MEIKINDLGSIREAARQFVAQIGEHKVFAFYGSMGAGKTTFVKAICEELGVDDVITSPTFAIINEYHAEKGVIYHFDFYRIKKLEEVYDIVEKVTNEEVLHLLCQWYASGCHTKWICHAWQCLVEEILHGRHSEDVPQCLFRMLRNKV